MKKYRYIIICIYIMFCSPFGFAEQQNTQSESATIQEPKVIATFELINKWKATLFVSSIIHKVTGLNNEEIPFQYIIYYVEISPVDTTVTRRIWQCEFSSNNVSPSTLAYNFLLGPMNNGKLCISFLQGNNINYFILDPNSNFKPYNEETKALYDMNSPDSHIINRDPNNVISLYPLSSKNIFPSYSPNNMFLNSVCGYENYSVFNLTIKKQKFILRYSIVDGKPVYSVYKVTDLEK